MSLSDLHQIRSTLHKDLLKTLKFWLKYSIDYENGGYWNCINEDGTIYDTTKYVWLQCRAVYMFGKLYTNNILSTQTNLKNQCRKACIFGAKFIINNALFIDNNHNHYRCYFSLTKNGFGLSVQRKIFSECFFVMAMLSYANLLKYDCNNQCSNVWLKYFELGVKIFNNIQKYINEPSLLGYKPIFNGTKQFMYEPLNIPMINLNIIDEIYNMFGDILSNNLLINETLINENKLNNYAIEYINGILKHVDYKNKCVRENVLSNGKFDNETNNGRMLCPGHTIECAWFMISYINKYSNKLEINKQKIMKICKNMLNWSWNYGWDNKYGGIYYFKDAKNLPRTELEWNQKLWWPINECMIAFALMYKLTNDMEYFKKLKIVVEYAMKYFCDKERGGWYGYLNEKSEKYMTVKGAAYKGFFHVPRSLLFTINIIDDILGNNNVVTSKL